MTYKKPGLLIWLDKKIKTKEDFQVFIVAIFVLLIICTKCYMILSPRLHINREAHHDQPLQLNQPFINSGFSFTK